MARTVKYPHVNDSLKYARAVVRGRILASEPTKLACKRQLEDLKRWKGKKGPYIWDPEKAERVCRFIENLPHIKGEWAKRGEYIKLEPWQKFIYCTVFGWTKPDGNRRFKTAYCEVPRKNSKSTMSAGLGLFMLTADGEAGAEVYSAAVTRDQAKIVFNDAQNMARREAEFRDYYGVQVNAHNINVLKSASKFEAISSEAGSQEGLNISCGIIDEVHAHKTRQIYDVIETGTGARQQPLIWNITTAGSNRTGICYELRTYLLKILRGQIQDETFFGIIYTCDEGDDWRDPKTWQKANPNYGVSVMPEQIERLCKKAQEMASAQNSFLTKHLDMWVNADTAWMNMNAWDACADTSLRIEDFQFEPCWMGLDLASRRDVTCKYLLFKKEDIYYGFLVSYLPEDNVHDDAHAETAHYEGWAIDGWLTLTPGNATDFDQVEQEIREDRSLYDFGPNTIGFDPWQAAQMTGRLVDDGFPMIEIRPNVQNFSDPMKAFESLVLGGKFRHDGNPIMTWMISNVVCHTDAKDNIYPRKEQPQNKIDGVVAAITAFNRALAHDDTPGPSVYEERGLLTL